MVFKLTLIEDYMKMYNISKRQFAKRCDVPYVVIEKIFKQQGNFKHDYIFNLANVLNVTVSELFMTNEDS